MTFLKGIGSPGNLAKSLFQRVDGSTLSGFRIIWGLLLFGTAVSSLDQVGGMYAPGFFHFRYFGFEWVPVPETEIETLIEITFLGLLALGIAFGILTRFCLIGYGLVYLHLFLIEQVYYNNHYYLTILVCGLLALTNSDCRFSLAALIRKRKGKVSEGVPLWQYWVIRLQVVIVYFFGGIAKLNPDWIRGEPLRYWFRHGSLVRWPMESIAKQEWFIWFASWSGILIDLICPFLLLFRKTKWISAIILISFHCLNSRLFNIGWFPFLGIALLIPFLDPDTVGKYWAKLWKNSPSQVVETSAPTVLRSGQKPVLVFLCVYFFLQVVLPLRHIPLGLSPTWSEVGHQFSWRMMLRNKDSYLDLLFDSPEAHEWFEQNQPKFPNLHQRHFDSIQETPWLLLQYVRALDQIFRENGHDTAIRAVLIVSLNDHPYQFLIDPSVDLTESRYSALKDPDWVMPFDSSLRSESKPVSRSDRRVALQKTLERFRALYPEKSKGIADYKIVLRGD